MKDDKRIFFHNGTRYIYTGDHSLAHSHFHEVRAHLGSLKRINVNDSKLVNGAKYFTDGTTAVFQVDHGREAVSVFAPIYRPVPKGGFEPRKTTDEVEIIVPCIRSDDGRYWIACLSGTFDGPYYAFKNIYDIPWGAFAPAIESDLDGQLISVGTEEIEDGIDMPQLYFIAQSGNQPPFGTILFNQNETSDVTSNVWEIDKWVDLCPDGSGHLSQDFGATKDDIETSTITVMGDDIGIPKEGINTHWDMTRVDSRCGRPAPTTEGEVWAHCDTSEYTYLPAIWWIDDINPSSIQPQSMDRLIREVNVTLRGSSTSYEAISIEFNAMANHAAVYEKTQTDSHKTNIQDVDNYCAGEYLPATIAEEITTTITVNFKVDDRVFVLSTAYSYDDAPSYYSESVKYYNTDNIAAMTALLGADVYTVENVDGVYVDHENYEYYYVGPNSKNELNMTPFPGDYDKGTHIIPNVQALPKADELIGFDGMVFLGRIVYEVERKLADREVANG